MAAVKDTYRTGWREAWGILLQAVWILMVLSLLSYHSEDISLIQMPPNQPAQNFIGPVGAWLAFLSFMAFGVGGYLLPLACAYFGFLLIFKREGRVWTKALWLFIMLLATICLLELQPFVWTRMMVQLNIGSPGGILGELIGTNLLVRYLGTVGAGILAIAVLLMGATLLFDIHLLNIFRYIGMFSAALYRWFQNWLDARRDEKSKIEKEEKELAKRRKRLEEAMRVEEAEEEEYEEAEEEIEEAEVEEYEEYEEEDVEEAEEEYELEEEPEEALTFDEVSGSEVSLVTPDELVPKRSRKKKKAETEDDLEISDMVDRLGQQSNYVLPPMSLLETLPDLKDREVKGDFQASSRILKETLAEFGIEVDVTNVERGPVVTRYELLPAPGVRLEKIVGLSNNIALAMKAKSVRVQAPIPGKGVVGVEVPNSKTALVYLREILECDAWKPERAALPLALGKDVGGRPMVADLAEMPHLLIAGATGAGKTVCMNSILAGLLMTRTPEEMRLMLIDPKIVEFSAYNHLPHLVVPVITDSKKVSIGLRWAINEMENRYKLFAKAGVRNIKSFNSRPIMKQTELFEGEESVENKKDELPARLPYIAIIIDELADLMLVAQAEIENSIARLAQLSRAVGIHMIIATQRPSVNVITGTIKANFPARIAFQVAQKTDSRTILDAAGADKLLGKGDMLFLPPGTGRLVRAQGTMTTDDEIHSIVDFIKKQAIPPRYETAVKEKIENKAVEIPGLGEDDELLEAAIEIIRQTRRASTSSLQRRLRIGYTRAARLIDILEEKGVVGPPCGSDPREILIDLDGEIPQNESITTET